MCFTLAETLTTLMVIGVVAALTIPNLIQNFQEQTLSKQKTVFSKKFEEGLRRMRVDDKLNTQYSSTEEFVEEMKKYFKIAQICDNNNLANCFTEKFIATNTHQNPATNNTYYSANIKTIKDLRPKTDKNNNISGIKFSDGTSILLAYYDNCIGAESGNTQANVFSCIGYIADVNGEKAPNSYEKDIIGNIPLIPNFGLSFEISEKGLVSPGTEWNCINATTATGIENSGLTCDYYLGAKRYCENLEEAGGGWQLANIAQGQEMSKQIYQNANCENIYHNCDKTIVKSSALYQFFNNKRAWIISDVIDGRYIWFQDYKSIVNGGLNKNASDVYALCVR